MLKFRFFLGLPFLWATIATAEKLPFILEPTKEAGASPHYCAKFISGRISSQIIFPPRQRKNRVPTITLGTGPQLSSVIASDANPRAAEQMLAYLNQFFADPGPVDFVADYILDEIDRSPKRNDLFVCILTEGCRFRRDGLGSPGDAGHFAASGKLAVLPVTQFEQKKGELARLRPGILRANLSPDLPSGFREPNYLFNEEGSYLVFKQPLQLNNEGYVEWLSLVVHEKTHYVVLRLLMQAINGWFRSGVSHPLFDSSILTDGELVYFNEATYRLLVESIAYYMTAYVKRRYLFELKDRQHYTHATELLAVQIISGMDLTQLVNDPITAGLTKLDGELFSKMVPLLLAELQSLRLLQF